MKTGISTASFFLRKECEKAIEEIRAQGADCAEIFLGTYYEYRPEFAKAHAAALGDMPAYSVHALSTNFEPQLFSASRRVRGDAFYWLDQIMRSAQLFGAKNYTFHGYIGHTMPHPDYGGLAGYMNAAAEFCSRYGVRLCLENVAWGTYNRPGVFGEFKSRCGGLAGVLDVKQARRSHYPVQMYINDMQGCISHVHLSDFTADGKICLPGKGVTDFTELFRRLKDAGFDGAAIIEVYSDNFGDFSELSRSLDFLREIIYKIS